MIAKATLPPDSNLRLKTSNSKQRGAYHIVASWSWCSMLTTDAKMAKSDGMRKNRIKLNVGTRRSLNSVMCSSVFNNPMWQAPQCHIMSLRMRWRNWIGHRTKYLHTRGTMICAILLFRCGTGEFSGKRSRQLQSRTLRRSPHSQQGIVVDAHRRTFNQKLSLTSYNSAVDWGEIVSTVVIHPKIEVGP